MKKITLLFSLVLSLWARDIFVEDSTTTAISISNKSLNYFAFEEAIIDVDYNEKNMKGLLVEKKTDSEFTITFKFGKEYEQNGDTPIFKNFIYSDEPSEIFFKGKETGIKYIFRLIPSLEEDDFIFNIRSFDRSSIGNNNLLVNAELARVRTTPEFNSLTNIVSEKEIGDLLKYEERIGNHYLLEDGNYIHNSVVKEVSNTSEKKNKIDTKIIQATNQEYICSIEKKTGNRQNLINLNKSVFTPKKSELYNKYKTTQFDMVVLENDKYIITHLVRKDGNKYVQDIYQIKAIKDEVKLDEADLQVFKNLPPNKFKKSLISIKRDLQLMSNEKTLLAITKERY